MALGRLPLTLSSRTSLLRLHARGRGRTTLLRATENDDFESLFAKELKRRGMEGEGDGPVTSDTARKEQSAASTNTQTRTRAPPPSAASASSDADDQRQRSISFVNEGLEGLPRRGGELLKLGGSVFLGYLPFMLAFSLLFSGIFFVFGDSFIHGGKPGSGPPPYVDPEVLLSRQTVDPYIPYQ